MAQERGAWGHVLFFPAVLERPPPDSGQRSAWTDTPQENGNAGRRGVTSGGPLQEGRCAAAFCGQNPPYRRAATCRRGSTGGSFTMLPERRKFLPVPCLSQHGPGDRAREVPARRKAVVRQQGVSGACRSLRLFHEKLMVRKRGRPFAGAASGMNGV